jgi:DNA-binding PadR family transcriptional regulator
LSPLQLARIDTVHVPRIYMCRAGTRLSMDKDRGGPLRTVEFHILISLAAGERHGYGIIQDIEARGETAVPDVGTMYRALARMVEHRLIESSARRPAPDAGDERRNYYRITNTGLRLARGEAQRLMTLMRAARSSGLIAKGTR